VKLDELPHNSQNVLLVTGDKIVAADTRQLQSKLLANLDSLSAVDALLVSVVGLLVDYLPVDGARLELIQHLQNDQSIADIVVEVVNIDILNVETVDPETEGALLSAAFNIIIDDTKLLKSFFLLFIELF
jgi:hypothetical protein